MVEGLKVSQKEGCLYGSMSQRKSGGVLHKRHCWDGSLSRRPDCVLVELTIEGPHEL